MKIKTLLPLILLLLAACNAAPASQPPAVQPPSGQAASPSSAAQQPGVQPTIVGTGSQVFLPEIHTGQEAPAQPAPQAASAALAYLKNGDLWRIDLPGGIPTQVTRSGGLLSFAWAPDGSRLATFDGRSLCFTAPDGAPAGDCLPLNLDAAQAAIARRIAWAPDQRTIVLWNPTNPEDESALGWIIVPLDGSSRLQIADPVDWGASLAPNNDPGGVTGQALFLADGSLLGSISHRWLCGAGGCRYQLFRFDFASRSFIAYPNRPEEGWSEGLSLVLSANRSKLANYSVFAPTCETTSSFVDIFDLQSQGRQSFSLEQTRLHSLALSPNASQVLLARLSGCALPDPAAAWSSACGLAPGLEVYPMQMLDAASSQRRDLFPGLDPAWSPDGRWIAFRSCLAQDASGGWQPSASAPPSLYLMAPDGNSLQMLDVGSDAAWKP